LRLSGDEQIKIGGPLTPESSKPPVKIRMGMLTFTAQQTFANKL